MKRNSLKVYIVFGLMALIGLIVGCGAGTLNGESFVRHTTLKEEARLVEDDFSPVCSFAMQYSWVNEKVDSVASLINHQIQREILGEDYALLSPTQAADSFKNVRLNNYRKEVGPLYLEERKRVATAAEIPQWFNHTYELTVHLEEGYQGILNCQADSYEDHGGAHPNSRSRWLNFDKTTGKLLTREDIFLPSAKADVEALLFDALLSLQAGQNPDMEVETLEDLQELGFLKMTDMYIPENILLGTDQVSFLYNRYDIAPYSAGKIVLQLTYEELKTYMKINE